MVPLYTVAKDSFRELVLFGRFSKFHVMSVKTLRGKIIQSFVKIKRNLCDILAKQEFVSTTADLWTKARRYINDNK